MTGPANCKTELLDALEKAHHHFDILLAMLIENDKIITPTKLPFWHEVEQRAEILRKNGRAR